jgi:hypothetical protein
MFFAFTFEAAAKLDHARAPLGKYVYTMRAALTEAWRIATERNQNRA